MIKLNKNSTKLKLINFFCRFLTITTNGVRIGRGSSLRSKIINIGDYTRINGSIKIKGSGEVHIGRYCAIADDVRIISSNHSTNVASVQLKLQKDLKITQHINIDKIDVAIGHDVWIGDRATILPGVRVGNGAIIGAGAVVTKSIEPYTISAGNPARPIGRRLSVEVASKLQATCWWDWNQDQLRAAASLFQHEFKGDLEDDLIIIENSCQSLINQPSATKINE